VLNGLKNIVPKKNFIHNGFDIRILEYHKEFKMLVNVLPYLLLGVAIGGLSGLLGIGGGTLFTPALIYLFGFSQHMAQGTTLMLLVPPIGLLAAWTYYQQGYVDLRVGIVLCIGFALGSLFGAQAAIELPVCLLQRLFGILMLLIALRMIFIK
jgi:uncharacterized protein